MREIALDTETTGFEPKDGHRMVEIGCVEMQSRIPTGEVFHFYINPQRDMPAEAQKVHGLSSEFLKDKPLFAEVAPKFIDFIADSDLVIHNAAFDMKFLNAELKRAGLAILPMERAIDTLLIARERYPGSPASLDALCRRYEIDLSARTQHGALLDAELLADVYLELMGGRQSSLTLESDSKLHAAGIEKTLTAFPYRKYAPNEAERAAHDAFLAQLNDPLWKKQAR